MHPSSVFHTDEQVARTIVRDNPLATIAVNGLEGPIVAVVPLVWSENGSKLLGHVAKSNAFWNERSEGAAIVSAIFHAGDGYVSASAYPSKSEHGRVVPTWNYIAAEARGNLTFKTGLQDVRASVAVLSDQMEATRSAPWSVDDAPDDYIDKLVHAIVAFEITVTSLKGVRKLSQNKSESDRAGVVADLTNVGGSQSQLTNEMAKGGY